MRSQIETWARCLTDSINNMRSVKTTKFLISSRNICRSKKISIWSSINGANWDVLSKCCCLAAVKYRHKCSKSSDIPFPETASLYSDIYAFNTFSSSSLSNCPSLIKVIGQLIFLHQVLFILLMQTFIDFILILPCIYQTNFLSFHLFVFSWGLAWRQLVRTAKLANMGIMRLLEPILKDNTLCQKGKLCLLYMRLQKY